MLLTFVNYVHERYKEITNYERYYIKSFGSLPHFHHHHHRYKLSLADIVTFFDQKKFLQTKVPKAFYSTQRQWKVFKRL